MELSPDNDALKDIEAIDEKAHRRAIEELHTLDLPNRVTLAGDLSCLGRKAKEAIKRDVDILEKEFRETFPDLVGLAVKYFWYAGLNSAAWIDEARLVGIVGDTEYTRLMSTPAGYIELEGGAWTMYGKLTNEKKNGLADFNHLAPKTPSDAKLLSALSCFLFYEAARLINAGMMKPAFNFLYEANDANLLSHGLTMWNDSSEFTEEELRGSIINETRSQLAKTAAAARFERDPKQAEKRFIHNCWLVWQEKPDNYPSQAAFARDMLQKCEHVVSQKSIEDWCRQWAKEHDK